MFGSAIYQDHKDLPVLHLWKDLFQCIELKENVRQKGDTSYARILNRIRAGNHATRDIRFLKSKQIPKNRPAMNIQHMYPAKKYAELIMIKDWKSKLHPTALIFTNSMLQMKEMVKLMMMMIFVGVYQNG